MEKVNIAEKLALIEDQWNPRIVAELNGQQIRLVKIQGDRFEPHVHVDEDELFFVVRGWIFLDFIDHKERVEEGEFIVVPKGTLHRPIAEEEAELMMFVTSKNVNTGDKANDFTLDSNKLERL
jgi:mannose-6-phosphate isomerase-like protein (cupin superfamily)